MDIRSIFDGAINQRDDTKTLIAARNVINSSFYEFETEILYIKGNYKCLINKVDIMKNHEDGVRNKKNSLDQESISNKSFQLKGLMREFKHLPTGSVNILYR